LPGVKQLLHKFNHSHPFGAKVLNEWSYTSTTSTHVLMAWTQTTFSFVLNHGLKIQEKIRSTACVYLAMKAI
jgi:hypothetical protein